YFIARRQDRNLPLMRRSCGPASAPPGIQRERRLIAGVRDELATAGVGDVELAIAEAAVRRGAAPRRLVALHQLAALVEDEDRVAEATGDDEVSGGGEAEAVGIAVRQHAEELCRTEPCGRPGVDPDALRHALRHVQAIVAAEGDAVGQQRDLG